MLAEQYKKAIHINISYSLIYLSAILAFQSPPFISVNCSFRLCYQPVLPLFHLQMFMSLHLHLPSIFFFPICCYKYLRLHHYNYKHMCSLLGYLEKFSAAHAIPYILGHTFIFLTQLSLLPFFSHRMITRYCFLPYIYTDCLLQHKPLLINTLYLLPFSLTHHKSPVTQIKDITPLFRMNIHTYLCHFKKNLKLYNTKMSNSYSSEGGGPTSCNHNA